MPLFLCEQILSYITYEGEVVLDTFAGSGVVGEVALNLRRNCILIELLKENVEKIKARLGSKVYFEVMMETKNIWYDIKYKPFWGICRFRLENEDDKLEKFIIDKGV